MVNKYQYSIFIPYVVKNAEKILLNKYFITDSKIQVRSF